MKRPRFLGALPELSISRFIFRFLRLISRIVRPPSKSLTGWFFAHMSFLLPAKRLHETDTLLAFHHPRPSYPVHILLVPKKAIASLAELTPNDQDFLRDLFACVQRLVSEMELEAAGYRLILNGGRHQDIPQLHFHLISDKASGQADPPA